MGKKSIVLEMLSPISRKAGDIYMVNFVDEYPRQLDERGRLILPAKIREMISETVYVTCSLSDNCLLLFTEEEWSNLSEKVNKLPTATDRNAAAFVRLFFGRATSATVDKQGRIPVSKRLIDEAGLGKDVVLVGANTRLELWDSAEWERYQKSISDEVMMEGVLKYDLNI
ncbi:MAG: division/cell wall cluster transcriptional repressor MraZ [Clostridia bacterium]|nr:division/cell wall cluster transcriptional repressor MraZ [Clostridia bacterium]